MGMMSLVLLIAVNPSHGFHTGGCKDKRRLNIATSAVGGVPQNKLGTVLPFATRVGPINKTPEDLAKQMRALLSPDINPEDIDEATLNWYLVDRYEPPPLIFFSSAASIHPPPPRPLSWLAKLL